MNGGRECGKIVGKIKINRVKCKCKQEKKAYHGKAHSKRLQMAETIQEDVTISNFHMVHGVCIISITICILNFLTYLLMFVNVIFFEAGVRERERWKCFHNQPYTFAGIDLKIINGFSSFPAICLVHSFQKLPHKRNKRKNDTERERSKEKWNKNPEQIIFMQ